MYFKDNSKIPVVSVVVPAFNAEKTIGRALCSVLTQTLSNLEVIVVDDGSLDATVATVDRLSDFDGRIRLIKNGDNKGAGVTRNRAIEAARGRFIAFLDADDEWTADKLQRQLHFMSQHNDTPMCCAAYRRVEPSGRVIIVTPPRRITHRMLAFHNYVGCLTAIYDTTRTGGKVYMPTIRRRQDWALWLRITTHFGPAAGLPDVLGTLHRESSSLTTNKWKSSLDTAIMLQEELGLTRWRAFLHSMVHNVIAVVRLQRSQSEVQRS